MLPPRALRACTGFPWPAAANPLRRTGIPEARHVGRGGVYQFKFKLAEQASLEGVLVTVSFGIGWIVVCQFFLWRSLDLLG
jgi:hypothetical protein